MATLFQPRHTLFFKFAGWLSLSILLGILTTVAVHSRISNKPTVQYLENMAIALSKDISRSLAMDIWNLDVRAIHNHFKGTAWDHLGLVDVKVRTEFKDVIYRKIWSDEADSIVRAEPVFYQGKIIGYIEVSVSKKRIFFIQNALEQSGFLILSTAFVLIWLVTLILLRLIIVRPLRKIIIALRKIASGDYGYQLPQSHNVEIDDMIREINAMSVEIQKHHSLLQNEIDVRRKAEQDLAALNRDLDQRVKDRTQQLRRMTSMLASAQDTEQRRIAEGLHDDVAQLLAAGRLKLRFLARCSDPEKTRQILDEVDGLITQANNRVRHLSFELASSTLARLGLRAALEELCEGMNKRYHVNFTMHCEHDPGAIREETATILFKAARELLFNVVKHAGTDDARIFLSKENQFIKLVVEDHGKGFQQQPNGHHTNAGSGLGLFGIRERLQEIGGTFLIESEPGKFTRAILLLPLMEESPL